MDQVRARVSSLTSLLSGPPSLSTLPHGAPPTTPQVARGEPAIADGHRTVTRSPRPALPWLASRDTGQRLPAHLWLRPQRRSSAPHSASLLLHRVAYQGWALGVLGEEGGVERERWGKWRGVSGLPGKSPPPPFLFFLGKNNEIVIVPCRIST